MTVVDFPVAEARRHSARARLAQYLRELAEGIEVDNAEVEPVAALIVLTGPHEHEVVCCGYADDESALDEAGRVAQHVIGGLFLTLGGNRRKRGDYAPRPMTKHNIVGGQFPRKAEDTSHD